MSDALDLAKAINPIHNLLYYAPEVDDFKARGMRGWWMSYFAYRSAPFGVVPAEVVTAAFYNFAPRMVERAIPAVWDVMSPGEALALRLDVVDRALRRLLGPQVSDEGLTRAAALARSSIEGCDLAGRPLYAAHAALPWPEEAHLVLWHATTLLREHRGDCHNLALAAAGLDGVAAHVAVAASGQGNKASILPIRGWTSAEWDAAAAALVARGWLEADGVTVTEAGRGGRRGVEQHTDRLAGEPVERLGAAGLAELRSLLAPTIARLVEGGGVPTSWPPPHLLRS